MKKYQFNQSQEAIWMNEQAYPGKAINTIGIRMYFPEYSADTICEAVNHIINSADIFRAVLTGDGQFEKLDEPVGSCSIGNEINRDEANNQAAWRERQSLSDLYDALVWPLKEGGSLLSFCFHHIIIDGYGMCLVAKQILNHLEYQPVELLDFFCDSNGTERRDEQRNKDFWLSYMEGLNTKESLFEKDVKRLTKTSYRYSIPDQLGKGMEDFAKANGVTVASVMSAAFSVYMSRAMQGQDVVFHMPRLNRDDERQRKIAGCYTMVVPVRVTVDEREGFADLCQKAFHQARLASRHKHYSYHQLLTDLRQRERVGAVLTQYTLNFYSPRLETKIPHTIEISVAGSMHNHLTLNVFRLNDGYEICYDARDEVYDEKKVDFFHRAFLSILEKGMSEGSKVEQFEIISPKEKRQLLFELQGKAISFDQTETIPRLFGKAAFRYSKRPALYAGVRSLTYSELDLLSNGVANALLERGIRSGDFVMFMLERDYRLLPVILGILKAGAVFVPVDPSYPKGRIDYMVQNCQARMLISDPELPDMKQYEYVSVDSLIACENRTAPEVKTSGEQAAYCIYTSGTTGKPKGVVLSHKGIVNITRPDNNPFNSDICECGKGIAAIGSICFDISLFEIFVPLLNGMFVELVPDHALADPKELSLYIQAHGANLLHCTPSRLATYLNHPEFAEAMKQIDVILSAGEVLPEALTKRIMNEYGIRVYNGYGPTEVTIGATITQAGDLSTIGRPIANTGILIIDQKGRLLPFGVSGELAVYGSGVGIGYLGKDKLTRERFCRIEGYRVYRTGDLGRYMEDGRIVFQGRNDQQIKLRGLRIEPAEIENGMLSYEGIVQACVMVRKIGENEHLVGFYSVKPEAEIEEDELRAFLKERLALYMVPDILQQMERIPQTAGGKTDYQALNLVPVDYVRNYRKPETMLEKAICESYEIVLEQKPIGMDDHFFELGGTSLDVASLIVEIEERVSNVDLDYGDLFQHPTPELLARRLNDSGRQPGSRNLLKPLDYDGFGSTFESGGTSDKKAGSLGKVLLTGATGYLGIHLLAELLKQPGLAERIYCIVRPKGKLTALKRLQNSLFYYHDFDFGDSFFEKVTVLEGDLTEFEPLSGKLKTGIDTVIHSAANVAHFAYGDVLEKMNTGSVKRLLRFCKEQSAQLIHISTISVGGVYPIEKQPLTLTEKDLFIGQEIHSSYVLSKYMAEYESLKCAFREGVSVKIMRVGNLQGRISDGEFQMNIGENAFTRQLSGYVKLGKVPASLYESHVNFSPVDEVARMILVLSRADAGKRVFHVYPTDEIQYASLFEEISRCGHNVEVVSDKEFHEWTDHIRKTKEGRLLMENIFIDKADLDYAQVRTDHTLTRQLLSRFNESWRTMTGQYFRRYVEVLDGMMLFDR